MKEFLLCTEMHWTWMDIQMTPKPVLDYFAFYRDMKAQTSKPKD